MNAFRNIALVFLALLSISNTAYCGRTEAIQGKRYHLTNQHGPWMIMVASLSDVKEENRINGLTAWEAADTIVYELRTKGIPAYTYSVEEETDVVDGPNSIQNVARRVIARQGEICVLAGNFKSIDDEQAQAVLKWIKKKYTSSIVDEKKGGLFAKTPGQPSPFGGAMLTINPIYSGEIQNKKLDDVIVDLNNDTPFTLLENPGKFTLHVATFAGGSVMQVGNQSSTKAMALFEQNFGSNLDDCAKEAMELAEALRTASKHGYDKNYEAWVFHDHYRSIVTVGSFSSKQDPRIEPLVRLFGGRAGTAESRIVTDDGIIPATFTLPQKPTLQNPLKKQWYFDAQPRIMTVPTAK
ncbi:MAG: hypothetical protein DWI29_04820 [Planctomycetota bacterium]|nr:MAG: hypothetical protein DWI29_04820 [Planctomycetota bacterium]